MFKKLHPAFTGKAHVAIKFSHLNDTHDYHDVDLDTHTCTCDWGAPTYETQDGTVVQSAYCSHKLKAIADIVDKKPDELLWPYLKALSTRYNVFEVTSAFHKELRKGEFEKAYYFGSILATWRSLKGIIRYMLNIVYEETRDHKLAEYLLRLYDKPRVDVADVCKAIHWFCDTKKKWEMPHRYDIFMSEMRGYANLAKEFTYNVAKPKEIIDASNLPKLEKELFAGFKNANSDRVQYGVKGLFKSKANVSHAEHKIHIVNLLEKVMYKEVPNKFPNVDLGAARAIHDFILRRLESVGDVGYHEINAFCDTLCGEQYITGCLSEFNRKRILSAVTAPKFRTGYVKPIPLYAHDNHTYRGKALMRHNPAELQPGAKQTALDFRWCGAYFGVAFRHLAYRQHGDCNVKWETVKWTPPTLFPIVSSMWY